MAGALEARQIPSQPGKLYSDVEGDIEDVEGVMRITEIRVRYHIRIPAGMREAAQRAVDTHPVKCPAAMSVQGCIRLKIGAEIEEV